jgi:hypothetical protein
MIKDLSPLVAVAMPLAGIAVAAMWGRRRASRREATRTGVALVMAIALGIGMTFAQNLVVAACIESKLCTNLGDASLVYVFTSLFATPVFWMALLIFARSKD